MLRCDKTNRMKGGERGVAFCPEKGDTMANIATKALAATAGVAAGAAALAAAAVAPRRETPVLAACWRQLARFRYAHRGLHDAALRIPENSLAAFRRAREHGFGSELDVHLTYDDALVVFHDWTLDRMCGVEGTIEELTLAELGNFHLLGTEEHIPTFEEVLEVYASSSVDPAPPLIVELKTYGNNATELCEHVLAALDASRVAYCIESFDPRVLIWLKRNRPEIVRGYLSQDFLRAPEGLPLWRRAAATYLLSNALTRPDFVAFNRRDLGCPSVRLARALGAHLATWTVRTPEELAADEALGAIGIFEGFVPDAKR